LLGVGLLVYVFFYLAKSDRLMYIQIDEYGQIKTT
jgi:hypothetical protein